MKALVKEIFIGVLLLMVVVFTLGILFYDSMPNNKATSTSITYTADSKVTTTIQQIAEEKANSEATDDSSNSSGCSILKSIISSCFSKEVCSISSPLAIFKASVKFLNNGLIA